MVHEILSTTVLCKGLAPTIHTALERLLVPEAPLLPELIGVEAVLSGDLTAGRAPWWEVEGFDLTPLALLDAASHGTPGRHPRQRLSEPLGVAAIDLRAADLMQRRAFTATLTASEAGTVTGVEQWMKVCFPGGGVLSSDDAQSHWGTCYHPFAASREVSKGETVPIEVTLNSRNLAIGLGATEIAEAGRACIPGWTPGL